MDKKVYLRSDIYFEPLFNKWFMWPYLLAPASAAMNVANHHMRLMKSFVANARIHAKSAKNKALAGSSLVDISIERVGDVKALVDSTIEQYGDLFAFSEAVKKLDRLLQLEAQGMSLEPMYARIPAELRGLVELHYDLNNQPSFRFFESLLYQSDYYKPQAQSICLGNLKSHERPFVLSTPRLPDEHHLHINVPFTHPIVELLFRMRDEAHSLRDVTERLAELDIEGGLAVDALFTEQAPRGPDSVLSDDVQIRYLGHAGIMVRTKQSTLMVDPVIAYSNDDEVNKTTFADIPERIDCLMVTHTHMDHVCLETLIQLRHKVDVVLVPKNNSGHLADPSIKLMLKSLGFSKVVEMEDLESYALADGHVLALPFLGEHADVNIRSKTAWLLDIKGQKIMAAADSSNLDEFLYQRLHRITGDLDMLFIGMECTGGPLRWLYGSLLTQPLDAAMNESRRFNGSDFEAASYMAKTFRAKQVYVYALGVEPWFGYFMGISYNEDDVQLNEARKLVKECEERGIPAEQLQGLKIWSLDGLPENTKKVMF
ncbi:MBL fold metallo-hydrolase [Paraglaciecola sp.]|uniref:MBL fold metallo-hydrolase n=1 Tax=Paraglaciecola sp. TaxID=1920173 RepID=UPI0030F43F1B